ncbi:MAG TPA: hypothetical protein VGN90_03305 [Pyrinomonadaceae bacterium]|nr:hypothetical protein [Pyrinomonadaceae bacterium]
MLVTLACASSCTSIMPRQDVRPLVLRDVPAQNLAYRFQPDLTLPAELKSENADDKIEAIQLDFDTRRPNDALLRTVRSPDGQRALVLYGTADAPSQEFHLDVYAADGQFLRNVTPPTLACVFPETVAWSSDGHFVTFIAHRGGKPTPAPTPLDETPVEGPEAGTATPLPSVAPAFAAIATFSTEQIYICDRDGYDLRPLTSRDGLIYFYAAWAPDSHALVAMACKESEWDAREKQFKLAAGRPRLINTDGTERLLDDELTEALPVWCSDSSKVATGFDTDVMIYDAATTKPTQARIRLHDALVAASRAYEAKTSGGKQGDANGDHQSNAGESSAALSASPASLNPIIRLEWPTPDKLYFETAYVRLMPTESITTFQRWHLLNLSPQAAVLK